MNLQDRNLTVRSAIRAEKKISNAVRIMKVSIFDKLAMGGMSKFMLAAAIAQAARKVESV
ncbi:hypothetical protein D3C76_1768080 [compost metagenome]